MRAIKGEEKVKAIYGGWPSFHDAEVWSLLYERVPGGFSVVAVIHVFETTPKLDARGYYVTKNHSRIRIRFEECSEVSLDGFNSQNVLFEFAISETEEASSDCTFLVRLDTSYGLAGTLRCKNIIVEDAERWAPSFGVYAEPSAAPNVGPAAPAGNSGIAEGPPSVS